MSLSLFEYLLSKHGQVSVTATCFSGDKNNEEETMDILLMGAQSMKAQLMKTLSMRALLYWAILSGFLWSSLTQAHEGHDHAPVSIKSAIEISLKSAKKYSISGSPFAIGKLPSSWALLTDSDASIHENGRGYYVVGLNNPQEGKTLYLKIMLDGAIAGANYSGEFASMSANSSSSAHSGG
jgi:hypothetical protein